MCAYNHILSYIRINMASRLKEVILPLRFVLLRPGLGRCAQIWGPWYKKGMDLLEMVQRRAIIRQLEHLL